MVDEYKSSEENQVDDNQEMTTEATADTSYAQSPDNKPSEDNTAASVQPSPDESLGSEESVAPTWAEAAIDDTELEGSQTAASASAGIPGQDSAMVEALSREVEALKLQLEERTSQYMRIVADFDNFRKRTQKEREEMEQQVQCSTLAKLLPVVDNFERARSQIKPQTDGEMAIHKSYQSVYKQFVDSLKSVGVSPMRAEESEFDPNLHEAVMREPTDQYPEGVVIEQLVRGYMLGDRVLRHAMVKVAAAPEPVITSSDSSQEIEDS